jgi:glycosyltransferase involved in cell wall biosynthesis
MTVAAVDTELAQRENDRANRSSGVARSGIRVLVLARSYPNPEFPLLGIWTQRAVRCTAGFAEVKVISPVPYLPPLPRVSGLEYYSRFRRVCSIEWDRDVEVMHPGILVGPGQSAYPLEAAAYALTVRRLAGALRRRFPFDVIHAHFTYPDGVAACALARRYGVPVVITEHAPWTPWMRQARLIRRQAKWAARSCDALLPVSAHVGRTIQELASDVPIAQPLHIPLDAELFHPLLGGSRDPNQLLFVGAIRHVKGVDVLVDALETIRQDRPGVRLVIAGEPFYRNYRRDTDLLEERIQHLGLGDYVEFVGAKTPPEVARLMAQSAVVVLPSRHESFGAVLTEALACGTPVVSTLCGGPEEIVAPDVGILVAPDDPVALAAALSRVLDNPQSYPAERLRSFALARFGSEAFTAKLAAQYSALRPGVR